MHWTLNNEDPLLLEFSKGLGNIYYFSSLLDFRWTDLPVRGIVVPLLYRLLILTGTDEINTAPVLINESKIIDIKESNLNNSWEVLSPSGKTELIVPNYDKENIRITQTNELGIYEVYNNEKLLPLSQPGCTTMSIPVHSLVKIILMKIFPMKRYAGLI